MSNKVIYLILLAAISGWIQNCQANANEDNIFSESTVKPFEINSGFFIFENQYVPPPYIVQSEGGSVYINGLKVPQRRSGPFFRRGVNISKPNRGPMKQGAAQIEQHLCEHGLLICMQSGPTVFLSSYQATAVLDILLGDERGEAKVQKLLQTDTRRISSDRWASLIETFVGTAELSERVQALKQHQVELNDDNTDDRSLWFFNSVLTFSGFILAVWALGTLISCRPPVLSSSRATVLSEGSCRQVIWLVVLVAVLNVYDLACTLIASSMGGLWELNPFASPIIHQHSGVVVFKLGLTVGAAILLMVTRRHRLAQIGSWWAGVLYTVLILRWTTFNTMFL